jgi:hypothetical protein
MSNSPAGSKEIKKNKMIELVSEIWKKNEMPTSIKIGQVKH